MEGIVIKNISNIYTVLAGDSRYVCGGLGKLKQDGKILVGDHVNFDVLDGDKGNITAVLPRKNEFVRPPVANIDVLVIVLSSIPEPDFMLVDKLIIFCLIHNIKPIICVNKDDIVNTSFKQDILGQYGNVVEDIVFVSAKEGTNISSLAKLVSNKTVSLVGQSAAGKSSIASALTGHSIETGDVSQKTLRGRQTTRHTEMYISGNIRLIDTAGFTSFELQVTHDGLSHLYPDFEQYLDGCKYRMCAHIKEREIECAIKRAVHDGVINGQRYQRYVKLYQELKDGRPQKINMKNTTKGK